jgi:DNA polymerase I-like protein with 3'-5' exonuclease and polymerase domains
VATVKKWLRFDRIAVDTETTGLRFMVDTAFGVSVSTPDGMDYYWDVRETPEFVPMFNDFLSKFRGKVIFHNAQFDWKMLFALGIEVPLDNIEDVAIRAKLIDNTLGMVFPWGTSGGYTLDNLARKYLGSKKDDSLYTQMAEILGGKPTRNIQMKQIERAPVEMVAKYAKKDARLTLDLFDWQEAAIAKHGVRRVCEFERQCIPVLIRASVHGIRVDVDNAEKARDDLDVIIDRDQATLDRLVGFPLNVNSPAQVKNLFDIRQDKFGDYSIKNGDIEIPIDTTETGAPSLATDRLLQVGSQLSNLIVELRINKKVRDTYITNFVINQSVGGRVYPTWNQVLDTGRLSIRDPSMQNMPSRNSRVAKIVKSLFLADEGQKWVDCDLASNEVRVFAHLASKFDNALAKEYAKNPHLDLHQYVSDLTGLPRNKPKAGGANGKQLNLSAIFNQGRGETANLMGLPWEWSSFSEGGQVIRYKKAGLEANAVIDQYHRRVRGVKALSDAATTVANQRGYLETDEGRRLQFKRGHKTYKASGLLIQATAGDINKRILLFIDKVLKNTDGNLLLNVHDSYALSLPLDDVNSFNEIAREVRNPTTWTPTRVPLILEYTGDGKSWWDAISNNKGE